jgi:hypothetical protein
MAGAAVSCDAARMPSARIRVSSDHRGQWTVSLPDHRPVITCDSLDEARRVARAWAVDAQPCELIVHDAYERVLEHELVGGDAKMID